MNPDQYLLRHFLATIAYRTQKALRGAPDSYSDFRAGVNVRTPHEIVWHMTGVLGYARTFFQPGIWQPERLGNFIDEVERLHAVMEDLARLVQQGKPRNNITLDQLLQGPLADAMTHVGQLTMLRRLAGSPVASENFIFAKIDPGNLSADQPPPEAPDPGWSPDLPPPEPGKDLPGKWYQK